MGGHIQNCGGSGGRYRIMFGGGGVPTRFTLSQLNPLTTKPNVRYIILLLGQIHKWGWGWGTCTELWVEWRADTELHLCVEGGYYLDFVKSFSFEPVLHDWDGTYKRTLAANWKD